MFKKSIFIMVLALMFAAVSLSYADFGLSARLGRNIGENNNFDHYLINTGISTPSITTDRLEWYKNYDKSDFINYGLEIFCEFPLSNKAFVGLKAGYVGYVNTDAQSVYFLDYYKYRNGSYGDIDKRYSVLYETSIESDAYEIPITIYYKEKINRIFSFYTGVGISFLSNKWTAKYYANTNYI
ncbi:MAG: hypothetical protein LBT79_04720, partial [Elusimicrobiota bacterium]|nr:hypothetical protein [Elusimicrobiota bacterium]